MAVILHTFLSQRLRQSGVEIEQIDPLVGDSWDGRVTAREGHTFFHRSAWARVLTDTYGHQPLYLRISVHGSEAALVPFMVVKSFFTGHRGVSLPFSDFAGPLWTDEPHAHLVYAALLELASWQGWKYLEIRGGDIPPTDAKPYQTYQTHQLDLKRDLETIHRRLNPSVRQALRKAERTGILVTVERGPAAMAQFYQLHARTRKRHGLPPQPLKFFEAIARNTLQQNMGFVVLAKLAGVPVAGSVFLHSCGQAIYKFGASEPAHWSLRPNHAVMWKAICELVRAGCHHLQFGRTSPGDDGLNRFKLSWGSVAEPLYYFRYKTRANAWWVADQPPAESHPMIFSRLPIACNRLAGRLIYPHLD